MSNLPFNSPFMDVMSRVLDIKKVEVYLPIANKAAVISPLLVGDDLSLRTSIQSPVGYDREIIKVIHAHTVIVEEEKDIKITLPQLSGGISNIDKMSLLWGLYKSTYDTLYENRKFICENKECKHEYNEDVTMDDLIHNDTYTPWDKPVPFYQYFYDIEIPYGDDIIYTFKSKLPSILENNKLLSTISIEVLQNNLQAIGSVFTRPQQMALLVSSIKVSSKTLKFEPVETSQLEEILISFHNHIPYGISEEFFTKYSEEFDKYVPKFYKETKCPMCSADNKLNFDIELEFFRRTVYGRTKSE